MPGVLCCCLCFILLLTLSLTFLSILNIDGSLLRSKSSAAGELMDKYFAESFWSRKNEEAAIGCDVELSYDFYTVGRRLTRMKPALDASCSLLRSGDKGERSRVRRLQQRWNNSVSDEQYLADITRCEKVVPTFVKNFYTSEKEKRFPLAFTMLISHAEHSIQQYVRLLRFIYRPNNVYCVHIDQKSPDYWIKSVTKFAACFPNILIARDAVEVTYASGAILTAHLNCLKELSFSTVPWKYAIDLHGTELPIVTNREIVEALAPLNGINAIKRGITVHDVDSDSIVYRKMTQKATLIPGIGMRLSDDSLGPVPYNMTLYKSADSPNSAFSRKFVHFLLTDVRAMELFEYLQDVLSAVEFYFNTLNNLPDAPGGRKEYFDNQEHNNIYIPTVAVRLWKDSKSGSSTSTGKPSVCLAGHFRHRICILSASDLKWLSEASVKLKYFFVNKYLVDYDHVVMDCMEELLLKRNLEEYEKDCVAGALD